VGQPKVSVIMPVYNAEKYLQESLDSITKQTLREIEIICVNDGSTDGTKKILEAAEKKDFRIKAIHQENQGAGPSRNAGIRAAIGQYIAFMDADDWFPNERTLEVMFNTANEHAALVCGGSLLNYSAGKTTRAVSGGISYFFEKDGWVAFKDFQQDYYYQRFIFERKMLVDNNIFFPSYRRYQDPPFFLKAMITAEKFYAITQDTYVYRVDAAHVNWTDQKVNDLLCALTDELMLTSSAQLADLHYRVANKVLNSDFYHKIIEGSLNQGNMKAGELLGVFAQTINTDLIGKRASKLNFRYAEVLSTASVIPKNASLGDGFAAIDRSSQDSCAPKVTIVIPVYNTEQYLAQCLDSAINQTYQNLEILCVNDGSKDNSLEILNRYQERDSRVVVVSQANGGLSAARNTGLKHATGDYVQFLDSDDVLAQDTVETLVQQAYKDDLDVLLFDADSFFETVELAKSKFHYKQYYYRKHSYAGVHKGIDLLAKLRQNGEYRSSACLLLLRREWLNLNEIRFRLRILHEDNLFTFVCLLNAERCGHSGKRGYLRRIREDSIMTRPQSMKNVRGYFECHIGMLDELSRHEISIKDYPEVESIAQEMRNNAKKIYGNLKERGLTGDSDNIFDVLMRQSLSGNVSPAAPVVRAKKEIATTTVSTDNSGTEIESGKVLPSMSKNLPRVPGHVSWLERIKHAILYILNKLRGGIRCYREHGFYYTLHRVLVHLHLREDPYE